MREMTIFNNPEFGEVRTIIIDGEPWFVGTDVTRGLGFKDNTSAMRNVDEDDKIKGCLISTPSRGTQQMTVINESGLYSLIFGSKLESAKKFKKWVTSEVLPKLRKTGSYGAEKLPQTPMELLELHYEAIKQVDKKVDTLEDRFNKLESDMPVFTIDAKNIQTAVKRKGIEVLCGKNSNAYRDKSTRTSVYADIQCMLRRNFGVRRYEEIKHRQASTAIRLVEEYIPPVILQEKVEMANSQLTLDL